MDFSRHLLLVISVFLISADMISAACDATWSVATMSGYDNLDGADDQHPGCLAEYCGTTENFLSHVPVVSILKRDWHQLKYSNIEVQTPNNISNIQTLQAWDECADADCDANDPNCCTRNAALYAPPPGFLLDVERRTLRRLFNLNYENMLMRVLYRICDKFDPKPIARQYGLHE